MRIMNHISHNSESNDSFIAGVFGTWLATVFGISSILRIYGIYTDNKLLFNISLGLGVIWPILYFIFSTHRFLPSRIPIDIKISLFLFILFVYISVSISSDFYTSMSYFVMTSLAIFIVLQFGSNLNPYQFELGLKIYCLFRE